MAFQNFANILQMNDLLGNGGSYPKPQNVAATPGINPGAPSPANPMPQAGLPGAGPAPTTDSRNQALSALENFITSQALKQTQTPQYSPTEQAIMDYVPAGLAGFAARDLGAFQSKLEQKQKERKEEEANKLNQAANTISIIQQQIDRAAEQGNAIAKEVQSVANNYSEPNAAGVLTQLAFKIAGERGIGPSEIEELPALERQQILGEAAKLAEAQKQLTRKPTKLETDIALENIKAKHAQQLESIKQSGKAGENALKVSKFERDLRKDYTSESAPWDKNYQLAQQGLAGLEKGTGAGDQVAIKALVQMSEVANSVVRESESAAVQQSAGAVQGILGQAQQLIGKGPLPPTSRKQVADMMKTILEIHKQAQEEKNQYYENVAEEAGVRPNQVVRPRPGLDLDWFNKYTIAGGNEEETIAPPQQAIDYLQQNSSPEIIRQFNAKYGEGSADQYLGNQ